jgi:hypothetical protein
VATSLGIRVGGGSHKVYNNYVEGVSPPGIFLEGGDVVDPNPLPDPCPGTQCDPRPVVTKTDVVFNTIVNSGGIMLGGGGHPLNPTDSNVAYNIVQGPGALFSGSGTNITFAGNIGFMGTSNASTGVTMMDPKLMMVGGVYTIGPGSPAVNAGTTMFPYVTDDIEGKPRSDGAPDVGANEVSSAPAIYPILTTADVGPMAP